MSDAAVPYNFVLHGRSRLLLVCSYFSISTYTPIIHHITYTPIIHHITYTPIIHHITYTHILHHITYTHILHYYETLQKTTSLLLYRAGSHKKRHLYYYIELGATKNDITNKNNLLMLKSICFLPYCIGQKAQIHKNILLRFFPQISFKTANNYQKLSFYYCVCQKHYLYLISFNFSYVLFKRTLSY